MNNTHPTTPTESRTSPNLTDTDSTTNFDVKNILRAAIIQSNNANDFLTAIFESCKIFKPDRNLYLPQTPSPLAYDCDLEVSFTNSNTSEPIDQQSPDITQLHENSVLQNQELSVDNFSLPDSTLDSLDFNEVTDVNKAEHTVSANPIIESPLQPDSLLKDIPTYIPTINNVKSKSYPLNLNSSPTQCSTTVQVKSNSLIEALDLSAVITPYIDRSQFWERPSLATYRLDTYTGNLVREEEVMFDARGYAETVWSEDKDKYKYPYKVNKMRNKPLRF